MRGGRGERCWRRVVRPYWQELAGYSECGTAPEKLALALRLRRGLSLHGEIPPPFARLLPHLHRGGHGGDRLIGDLLDSLTRAGLRDRATILVATDHGFKKVRKVIHTNVALRAAGLIRLKDGKVESCDAYAMPQGGLCFVYVTDPAKRAELLPKLKALCAGLEGVKQVIDGNDGPTLGMPTPAENQGMGDLVLYAKDGYAFFQGLEGAEVVRESKTYLGTHGYANTDPELDGIFLASGHGIRPGVKLERVTNLDVAPTIAELLGVPLPNVEGRVLAEILTR